MPENKAERVRRERKAGLDYLKPYYERLKQTIKALPEPKPKPKDFPRKRILAHTKLLQELPFLIEIVAGDIQAEFALAGIMELLRDLLPLDKDWQHAHVRKKFRPKEAHNTIREENERLDKEGAPKRGRPKIILKRNPKLKNASKGDPVRYICDRLREIYEN